MAKHNIEDDDEEQDNSDMILRETIRLCMQKILSGYMPATSMDADDYFTTQDLTLAIADHSGSAVPSALVYDHMIELGYTSARTGSSPELKWLLRKE